MVRLTLVGQNFFLEKIKDRYCKSSVVIDVSAFSTSLYVQHQITSCEDSLRSPSIHFSGGTLFE